MAAYEERNKALVLEAFDTLFNKRDYVVAQRFWSADYIQHSAHIEAGRDGPFQLVKASPPDMRYENGLIVADGDYVVLHGQFSNVGQPADWIVADVVTIEDRLLAEHWDVIQDEAAKGAAVDAHRRLGHPHRLDRRYVGIPGYSTYSATKAVQRSDTRDVDPGVRRPRHPVQHVEPGPDRHPHHGRSGRLARGRGRDQGGVRGGDTAQPHGATGRNCGRRLVFGVR